MREDYKMKKNKYRFICILIPLFFITGCAKQENNEIQLEDRIRIYNGIVQYYDGGCWRNVKSVDDLMESDPFVIAQEKRNEIELSIYEENKEKLEEMIQEFDMEQMWNNPKSGIVPVDRPKPNVNQSQSNSSNESQGGSSGGSNGNSGSSSPSSPSPSPDPTPDPPVSEPSTGDGEDMEWSDDML